MNTNPTTSHGSEQRMSAISRYANSETSRKKNDGMCTVQEYNQFKTRIFDAIDEWATYHDAKPDMGIAIDKRDLSVEVATKKEAKTHEWCPIDTLAPGGEADADAVLDLADQFCFVR